VQAALASRRTSEASAAHWQECRYYFLLPVFCERALPAADLEVALVRPSLSVLDAADAALLDVVSVGELRCVSALPAADFDDLLVDGLDRVLEAVEAAALLVCFLAIYASRKGYRIRTESSMPVACGGLTIAAGDAGPLV
jgi:hypothetical protein